ncbi:AI-2E family transporter [Amycolatopsis sp. FDAARGOS 1241]|uniref:AI-2E family transporter n=1 Tax=Amycolatopsis sp. FDAARGOS 1241 TaxID=2778070 RepID=UPI0019514C02|nr:AI-2E family transporter [Amycolatopsis sp. FDAARGOS 1241]QRP50085.1 AI-2E family transporter [Amycolatopsis sp. FDAARGOS 1241]
MLGNGFVTALILLVVVVGVQQLEAHVRRPVLTGSLAHLHPLVVLLAIAAGGTEAGVPGAIFAAPAVAAAAAALRVLADRRFRAADEAGPSQEEASSPTALARHLEQRSEDRDRHPARHDPPR